MELFELTIHELHGKLKSREVSSVEATRAMLARIEVGGIRRSARSSRLRPNRPWPTPRQPTSGSPPARWIADRYPAGPQGYLSDRGYPHHLRLAHPDNFIPPYSATILGKAQGAGRGAAGQAQPGRVRHGFLQRIQLPSAPPAIPGTPTASRAVHRAVRRRPSPPARQPPPSAPIPAAPSASRPPTAAASASSRPTAGSPATG